jgi:hypothetical protein
LNGLARFCRSRSSFKFFFALSASLRKRFRRSCSAVGGLLGFFGPLGFIVDLGFFGFIVLFMGIFILVG